MSGIPRCILCDSSKTETLATRDRRGKALRNVICCQCGLVRVDPLPDTATLQTFYASEYRLQYKRAWHPRPRHVFRDTHGALHRARRLLEFYRPGMSLLDIGCGAGFFLYLLKKLSIDAAGLEPNIGYAEFAREELQLDNIFNGTLMEFSPGRSFDLITINHVFEHLDQPLAALQKMAALLNSQGDILMEIPNIESTYRAPDRIFHIGHLYWFNPINIQVLVQKAGLTIADMQVQGGNGHINLVIRKDPDRVTVSGHSAVAGRLAMLAGNYQRVLTIRRRHTRLRHYTSPAPYRRLLRKCVQYAREWYSVSRSAAPRSIADGVSAEFLPALLAAIHK